MDTISLDGSKIHANANASRHSALSHGHVEQLENQLKHDEVQALVALAEQADQSSVPDDIDLPEEIARRETRLAALAEAKSKIETRARARLASKKTPWQSPQAIRCGADGQRLDQPDR